MRTHQEPETAHAPDPVRSAPARTRNPRPHPPATAGASHPASRSTDAVESAADRLAEAALRHITNRGASAGRSSSTIPPTTSSDGGHALDDATRTAFEAAFATDLARVRVHTGATAGRTAAALGAPAFAVRDQIAFAPGNYAPGTPRGERLLAHELAHVVQDDPSAPATARCAPPDLAVAPPAPPSAAPRAAAATTTTNDNSYVAIYLGAEADRTAAIVLHTPRGVFSYGLDDIGNLEPGEYVARVRLAGPDLEFVFDLPEGEYFRFSYRIRSGQPSPRTLLAGVDRITVTVTGDPPPAPAGPQEPQAARDPDATYADTPEEAMRLCESGEVTGLKVFPYRGTRMGAAPLHVTRDGGDIVVKSYLYVRANEDFRAQTRTLPWETFIGGVHLAPEEIVRVHTYEPRWYQLNITGSTSGDIEDEFCVTGEGMLEWGERSTRATIGNIALTAVDAATIFLPVGKLAGVIARPAAGATRAIAASVMLGLRDAAPTAFAGIAGRTATVLVEEQGVRQLAGRAMSESSAHVLIEFAEAPAAQVAAGAVRAGTGAGTGQAVDSVARVVTVTVVDGTGKQVVSTLTTPTADVEVDRMVEEAFGHTFDQQLGPVATVPGQGVVAVAPEIAAGFTAAQVQGLRRILGKRFDTAEIDVLEQLWNSTARPGVPAILTMANARNLFDLHRNRFWRAVASSPAARALFEDAGCQFSGGAPYLMLQGRRIVLTIDHVIERQVDPLLALRADNLRLAFSRENSVVLRLLNKMSPF